MKFDNLELATLVAGLQFAGKDALRDKAEKLLNLLVETQDALVTTRQQLAEEQDKRKQLQNQLEINNTAMALDRVKVRQEYTRRVNEVLDAGLSELTPEDIRCHASWMVTGEADPFNGLYDHPTREDAKLTLLKLNDYELANAVFMYADAGAPSMEDLISGKAMMPIAYTTAAKERIRWLSRQLFLSRLQIARLTKTGE